MSHVDHYRLLKEYSTPNGFITQNLINARFLLVVQSHKKNLTDNKGHKHNNIGNILQIYHADVWDVVNIHLFFVLPSAQTAQKTHRTEFNVAFLILWELINMILNWWSVSEVCNRNQFCLFSLRDLADFHLYLYKCIGIYSIQYNISVIDVLCNTMPMTQKLVIS